MRLNVTSQLLGDIVVIRCAGRIVLGPEVDALEAEWRKHTLVAGTTMWKNKKVVLHLEEADYIDSSGLGTIVRMHGVLLAAGGEVKLCQLSPALIKALEITNLHSLLATYPSEGEALAAFSKSSQTSRPRSSPSATNIVCIDPSDHLLAYLKALLKDLNVQVFTTQSVRDAATLITATRPRLIICGPGMMRLPVGEAAAEKYRQIGPDVHVMLLPSDFSTTEAGQAGGDFVDRVKSVLG